MVYSIVEGDRVAYWLWLVMVHVSYVISKGGINIGEGKGRVAVLSKAVVLLLLIRC